MRRRIVPGYGFGILLGIAAATCWSLGGVLVRLTDGIDSWQIVLYRSLTVLVLMGAWMALTHGRSALAVIRHAGLNGVVAGIADVRVGVHLAHEPSPAVCDDQLGAGQLQGEQGRCDGGGVRAGNGPGDVLVRPCQGGIGLVANRFHGDGRVVVEHSRAS